MKHTYRIYGHSQHSKIGFATPAEFRNYIQCGIFDDCNGRYRYSKSTHADTIVLSRDGLAYGHFDIVDGVKPTKADLHTDSLTRHVFIVGKSTLYKTPVKLTKLGMNVGNGGLPIDRTRFQSILANGGVASELNMKYCRICFNRKGWAKPSKSAHETKSHYALHHFGHEEWLFNSEWCLDGYKWGFLQPFVKVRPILEGKWFSLVLYTKDEGQTLLAARIHKAYIPTLHELQSAFKRMDENGWIDEMGDDLKNVEGCRLAGLSVKEPELMINVRFKPEDVTLYDRMPIFPQESTAFHYPRYKLLPPDGAELPTVAVPAMAESYDESQRIRAAQQATTVDPAHVRLQNRLYESLCKLHGAEAVHREMEFVDLRLTNSEGLTFYEIKTDSSAKRCIRNALGQLFEYSAYPDTRKAQRWIVVGNAPATIDDIRYLQHLRDEFRIPLFYARFDSELHCLGEPL